MEVDDNSQQKTLTLLIKTPNQAQEDQSVDGVCLNWTVKDLKTHLSAVYPTQPVSYILRDKQANVSVLCQLCYIVRYVTVCMFVCGCSSCRTSNCNDTVVIVYPKGRELVSKHVTL